MNPRRLLAITLGLLVVAGCGTDKVASEEVPGPATELTVPHDRSAAEAAASPTPTPSATPEGAASTESGATGSTQDGTSSDTATAPAPTAAPAPADGPASDSAPEAGSAPDQFEQFCEQNAGAC